MSDEAWYSQSNDPSELLKYLGDTISPRKLRLFCRACVRYLLPQQFSREDEAALVMLNDLAEVGAMRVKSGHPYQVGKGRVVIDCTSSEPLEKFSIESPDGQSTAIDPKSISSHLSGMLVRFACPDSGLRSVIEYYLSWWYTHFGLSLETQADLFRDIVRGPFRPLLFRGHWRNHNRSLALVIASQIYNEEKFDDLPILADALEEAGCTEGELLGHLRDPGPHVRGCWAVDLVRSVD